MSWAEVKHALNSTLGTEDFQSLDKLISIRLAEWESSLQNHKYEIFETAGSHQYTVPEGVFKIYIAACGGGAGGTGAAGDRYSSLTSVNGAGGGGGAAVLNYEILVNPGDILNITVGAGGAGGVTSDNPTAGANGGDTIIGNYITLKGGNAGAVVDTGPAYTFTGGKAGGTGGGDGGGPNSSGKDGILGKGGQYDGSSYGGGGGGSIGNGGHVNGYHSYTPTYAAPSKGGGGCGGWRGSSNYNVDNGQNGASGYVMISVVEITADMINSDTAVSASYTETELMTAYKEGVESVG